ncbi:RBR-type E3 ubiquitin transferase [Trichostrongylus colubriformis]|uniref:RBR-type E3 ubiquitin transferase n=1 Tax=Trichostrongylus colubriformis TaxID=6319 RepID=A0AAN8F1F1_TRICO
MRSPLVTPLSCLSTGCNSYPLEKLIEELIGTEQFERYQRIILSNALARMDDMDLCPRARCQSPASKSSCTSTLAICPVCDFSFCVKCRRAYHGVNPCRPQINVVSRMVETEDGKMEFRKISVDEYLAATDDQRKEMAWWYGGMDKLEEAMDEAMGRPDRRSQEWLEKYTRRCPTCGRAIILTQGCNHVFCYCGTTFCYKCGEILYGGGSDQDSNTPQKSSKPNFCNHK